VSLNQVILAVMSIATAVIIMYMLKAEVLSKKLKSRILKNEISVEEISTKASMVATCYLRANIFVLVVAILAGALQSV